jgi:cation diffusion facilitator CzcD-associated flavoprotein CzcO
VAQNEVDVAIVGAGPYGLSIGAHLKQSAIDFKVFGHPMDAWKMHMPPGMFLKSDGPSTNLCGLKHGLSLEQYCELHGIVYDARTPIPLNIFAEYGVAFQAQLVPLVERVNIRSVQASGGAYALESADGRLFRAKRIIIAVGIYPFRFVPPEIGHLPPDLYSHSAEYGSVDRLNGMRVAVIGSGASAIDVAAALDDRGITPTIISRREIIRFQAPPSTTAPSLYHRLRYPDSGIGGGWAHKLYADAPNIVHRFPKTLRASILRNALGPSSGWKMKERVLGRIPIFYSQTVRRIYLDRNSIRIDLATPDRKLTTIEIDHVIAATGYRTDCEKLEFLAQPLRARIHTYKGSPILSSNFESSSPGLYFVGPASAMSFGPVMRFVFGARFTAHAVTAHLSRISSKNSWRIRSRQGMTAT